MTATDETPPQDEDTDDDLWGELLKSIETAEPEQTEPQPTMPKRGLFGMTPLQTGIVGVLLLMVLAVWALLSMTVIRSIKTALNIVTASDRHQGSSPIVDAEDQLPTQATGLAATPTPVPAVATLYDSEILQNPDDVDLRLKRGRVYLELGAFDAALSDFQHAVAIDNTLAEAQVGVAWASLYLRQWMAAETAFAKALSLDPNQVEARLGLGTLRYYQARFPEAEVKFERAVELQPDNAEAAAWLAIAQARGGNAEAALATASQTIDAAPELPLAYVARSWAYRLLDPPNIDSAQGDLLYAQNLAPYAFETLNALAEFYLDYRPERLGEAENLALYALDWAESDLERAVTMHTLGRIYIRQNRTAEAEAILTQAVELLSSGGSVVLPDVVKDLEQLRQP